MEPESRTRGINWLREDYARKTGAAFRHFYCPMLMTDEPTELMLGHVVNQKFLDTPEYRVVQRKDIDGWYGSMFEADFLTLVRSQEKDTGDLVFGEKPPRGVKPVIKAGQEEIGYYHLERGHDPIDEHTLMEVNSKNGDFLRLALKKSPEEVLSLQHVRWHSEVLGDFRIAALVSVIKAAYLTLFWKLGYRYALSSAGLSIGRDVLGRFYVENQGKSYQEVRQAAAKFFQPYVNMVRPAEALGGSAPQGTIEDDRVFVWLGSSGRGLGIGVFVRTDKRLQCVLMPGYCDAERAAVYLDFLRNDKHDLWVRDGQFNEKGDCWEIRPERVPVIWPKLHESFDLSRDDLRSDGSGPDR